MDKVQEIWKDVAGYVGIYQVSNLGRIKSLSRVNGVGSKHNDYILKLYTALNGYLWVAHCKNSIVKQVRVHRIVATAFIENPLMKCCVNHKDGDKTNNKVSNLEWVTHSENIKHAFATGLFKPARKIDKTHIPVILEALSMGFKGRDIAKYFNVSESAISHYKVTAKKCKP